MQRISTTIAFSLLSAAAIAIVVQWWGEAKRVLIDALLRRLHLSPGSLAVDTILKVIVISLPVVIVGWAVWPFLKARLLPNAQPVRKWLHPKDAYNTLTNRRLHRAWVKASQESEKAEAETMEAFYAVYVETRDKASEAGTDPLTSLSNEQLARYGYRAPNPVTEAATRKSVDALNRKVAAQAALDADFLAQLERGDLIAEGMRSNKDTAEIIERPYWRGSKIDKELLFNNRMQDLAGTRWITIGIGKKA